MNSRPVEIYCIRIVGPTIGISMDQELLALAKRLYKNPTPLHEIKNGRFNVQTRFKRGIIGGTAGIIFVAQVCQSPILSQINFIVPESVLGE